MNSKWIGQQSKQEIRSGFPKLALQHSPIASQEYGLNIKSFRYHLVLIVRVSREVGIYSSEQHVSTFFDIVSLRKTSWPTSIGTTRGKLENCCIKPACASIIALAWIHCRQKESRMFPKSSIQDQGNHWNINYDGSYVGLSRTMFPSIPISLR